MNTKKFGQQINSDIAVALGFFDSVHIGHRAVINKAIEYAKSNGLKSAVITYSNNPFNTLGSEQKLIFTFEERLEKFEKLGVDLVIHQEFDHNFKQKDRIIYANELIDAYNIKYAVCGLDYRFGKDGLGNIEFLKEFFEKHNIKFEALDFVQQDGSKISSSNIRKLIEEGKINKANKLLGEPFYITGRVARGNGYGRLLGYPTVNLEFQADKVKPLQAVYITKTIMGDTSYLSITKVGGRPTFSDNRESIETHILDFAENLYNRDIKIEFYDLLRPLKRFENDDQLKEQLNRDIKAAQEYVFLGDK
ncbi:MAG TPA: bifunctional riboflavin kinase/FAD synthetase [Clostridia bacterium]|jgi:riboflavin kinase/FMN adenylyltransferase